MAEAPEPESRGGRVAVAAAPARPPEWQRLFWFSVGIGLFALMYFLPGLPDATDPEGRNIVLTTEGRMALGLFLLAATWWVFEVIPIGVTAIAIAVLQATFQIRSARTAFTRSSTSCWARRYSSARS